MARKRQNGRRPYDDPKYRQRRAALMKTVGPGTRCWRCGKLAREHEQFHKSGRAARWQCGHTKDGDNTAPLALEWSVCNQTAGAKLGHRRAFGQYREAAEERSVGPHHPMHYDLGNLTGIGAPPCARTGSLCPTCSTWKQNNPNKRG